MSVKSHHNEEVDVPPPPRKAKCNEATFFEWVFRAASLMIISTGLYAIKGAYDFHTLAEYANVRKGTLWDFFPAVQVFFVMYAFRTGMKTYLYPKIKDTLSDKIVGEDARHNRAKKNSKLVTDIIIYTTLTILGFVLFRDQRFVPPAYGGSGSCFNLFDGWTYPSDIPYIQGFYMIQCGHQMYILCDHLVFRRDDPKYWELLLHHSMTCYLIFLSYFMNQLKFGVLVLMVHDPADIFICFCRAYGDYKGHTTPIQIVSYLMMMFAWVYTRLYVFPVCIIGETFSRFSSVVPDNLWYPNAWMVYSLCGLFVMHIFWFWHICRVAATVATGGKLTNVYDPAPPAQNGHLKKH